MKSEYPSLGAARHGAVRFARGMALATTMAFEPKPAFARP